VTSRPARIAFVAGDLGAANAMVPVMRELSSRTHIITGVADAAGVADQAFERCGLPAAVAARWDDAPSLREADLLVVGTSASATQLEMECSSQPSIPAVLFSDSYFNHANLAWREAAPRWWLAIDNDHGARIRALHPDVERVFVTGQPVFDELPALMPRKADLRRAARRRLEIGDAELIVWWSSGIGSLAAEDLAMAGAIACCDRRPLTLACAMHPKLEKTVGPGYVDAARARMANACTGAGIGWVEPSLVAGIDLCLAADVLLAITSTEDVKSTMVGGPPVVHLLGPLVRCWMEEDLLLSPPDYLPDISAGLSIAAHAPADVVTAIAQALDPGYQALRATRWESPAAGATGRTADAIASLAGGAGES
jgi:hypothetical protein